MSRARAFEWHRRFKEGSRRPATSRTEENVELVCQKLHGDFCLTVRMITNELDMNCKKVWTIITKDLGMRKICTKMFLKLLKEQHVQVCHDIPEQLEMEPCWRG